jgi:hypothetical protein
VVITPRIVRRRFGEGLEEEFAHGPGGQPALLSNSGIEVRSSPSASW